jgi:ribosomal protein S18 acetylase RimI-like enzyme
MQAICLHAKDDIAAVLRRRPWQHLYSLGDLDDFFWPYTLWYGSKEGARIADVVLVYTGMAVPVLHALADDTPAMRELLAAILHLLPRRVYAHLSAGLIDLLAESYAVEPHGAYAQMALTDPARLAAVDTAEVVVLTGADRPALDALYAAAYPGNWFDPRMLETGCYYGIQREGRLVSVAGVHVYAPQYGVAALGNITTLPAFRGQGLATRVTARLGTALGGHIPLIGLNVNVANGSAIACYERLGFTRVGLYGEYMLEAKAPSPAKSSVAK